MSPSIRARVSDLGGVLTSPLLGGFARIQADTGVAPEAFGQALAGSAAANGGTNPLFALEVGATTEGESSHRSSATSPAVLARPVTLHGFGERYLGALTANDALFAYYRALHERGLRLAMLTSTAG